LTDNKVYTFSSSYHNGFDYSVTILSNQLTYYVPESHRFRHSITLIRSNWQG